VALEYDLILIGGNTVEQVAERAFPITEERPTGAPPLLRSADIRDQYGFTVSVLRRQVGYVAVESDNGMWEFEPDAHVALTFYLDETADLDWSIANMLTVARRVLDSGNEDALLILDGDYLLLTRFGGSIVKHRRTTWWDHYPEADQVIFG
jgi:hypothetical protein